MRCSTLPAFTNFLFSALLSTELLSLFFISPLYLDLSAGTSRAQAREDRERARARAPELLTGEPCL